MSDSLPPTTRVFFKNVAYSTTEQYLVRKFKENVEGMQTLELWMDAEGQSKGMGTAIFRTPDLAAQAVDRLFDMDVDGRQLFLELDDPSKKGKGKGSKGKGKGDGKGYDFGKGGGKKGRDWSPDRHRGGSGPGPAANSGKIFFQNVAFETTPKYLELLFQRHGKLKDFHLWTDDEGRSRGMGIVHYEHPEDATHAAKALDGSIVDKRQIQLQLETARGQPEDEGRGNKRSRERPDIGGKGAAKGKPTYDTTCYFFNVPFETTAGYLKGLFKRVAPVTALELYKTPDGKSKGEGHVVFPMPGDAQAAVDKMHGMDVDGRAIEVSVDSMPRSKRARGPDAGLRQDYGGGAAGGGCCKVVFRNLLFETPQKFMEGIFAEHGEIRDFFLLREPDGRSKGCGVCEYTDPASAERAVRSLNGALVDDRKMTVELEEAGGGRGRPPPANDFRGGGGPSASSRRPPSPANSRPAPSSGNPRAGHKPTRVFFKNVDFKTPEHFMQKLFEQHGQVQGEAQFSRNGNGSHKGRGFVDFVTWKGAAACVKGLNGALVDNREISVELDDGRGAPQADPMQTPRGGSRRVFFKNVPYDTSAGFLKLKFSNVGEIRQFELRSDAVTGRSKGCGVVEYISHSAAQRAIKHLHNLDISGRPMHVDFEDPLRAAAAAEGRDGKGKGRGH